MKKNNDNRGLRVIAVVCSVLFVIILNVVAYNVGKRAGLTDKSQSNLPSSNEEIIENNKNDDRNEVLITGVVFVVFLNVILYAVLFYADKRKNISLMQEKEEDMRKELGSDPLTGLLNRGFAKEAIDKELMGTRDTYMAFLLFDLDGLKKINDLYGHDIGDSSIKNFSNALVEFFGKETILARIGGDEFICLIPDAGDERMLKARLKSFLHKLSKYTEGGVVLSASIGIATVDKNNRDFTTLYKQADTAMYYAKNNGKNGFAFYRRTLEREALKIHRDVFEIYNPDSETFAKKERFDFKDIFVWLMDNCIMDMPSVLYLKKPNDFLMVINKNTMEVLDVFTSKKCENPEKFKAFKGKKCYEVFSGGEKRCEGCKSNFCNRKTYSFKMADFKENGTKYDERLVYGDYNGEECLIAAFCEIGQKYTENDALKRAVDAQNLISHCLNGDYDPVKNANEYFKREIETLCWFFGAEKGYILCMDKKTETASYNIPKEETRRFRVDMSAYAAKHWRPKLEKNVLVYVDDVNDLDPRDERAVEYFNKNKIKNVSIAPIWDGIKVYGYICLENISTRMQDISMLCGVAEQYVDVMRRLDEKQSIYNQMYYDETTGYLNYEGFKKKVSEIEIYTDETNFALCAWDIRKFKYINEVYGYETGDKILKEVADAFARRLSGLVALCRISGDKFCALCTYEDSDELKESLEQINESVSNYFTMNYNGIYRLKMAIGVYLTDKTDTIEIDEMLNNATIAENDAKSEVNTCIKLYDEKMREKTERDIRISGEMENAIQKSEFELYLQPQVYIGGSEKEKSYLRAEVLCRWFKDGKIYSSPAEFIPIFEENGRIMELDLYMLRHACELIRVFKQNEKLNVRLAVNISRNTLVSSSFIEEYDSIIKEYKIEENELELEFTEGIAVTDFDKFYDVLELLKSRGCICAMDDFGSDYSSLNVLHKLPIDILKLDKKFFEASADEKRHKTIVENTIRMAKELDMLTIAEGIENEEQVDELMDTECDYIQGYVYARPMPVEEYIKWAKKYNTEVE